MGSKSLGLLCAWDWAAVEENIDLEALLHNVLYDVSCDVMCVIFSHDKPEPWPKPLELSYRVQFCDIPAPHVASAASHAARQVPSRCGANLAGPLSRRDAPTVNKHQTCTKTHPEHPHHLNPSTHPRHPSPTHRHTHTTNHHQPRLIRSLLLTTTPTTTRHSIPFFRLRSSCYILASTTRFFTTICRAYPALSSNNPPSWALLR